MNHSIYNELDAIYDASVNPDNLRNKNIKRYRTKTIKSGDVMEVQVYPIWNTYSEIRSAKSQVSTEAQKKLNQRHKQENVIRLLNSNFTDKDVWATFTYTEANNPLTYEDALKSMRNYIRRLKTYAARYKYPPLKYIYVTELTKKGIYHHHIVMNFKDRDIAEKLWKGGRRKQTRRLQADDSGYEGLARYITKVFTKEETINRNSYICSKNLKKPKVTVSDFKVSRAQARKIAEGRLDPLILFQKLYKGYIFNNIDIKTSDYIDGCYLYVKMHRFRI